MISIHDFPDLQWQMNENPLRYDNLSIFLNLLYRVLRAPIVLLNGFEV